MVTGNGFNRFTAEPEAKPLKRLDRVAATNTGLKPGVNERFQNNEDAPVPSKIDTNRANRLNGPACARNQISAPRK
jgi:hypothetical protein